MGNRHYKLSILPLFEEDLNDAVDYIAHRLKNPIAANDLIDAVELAIQERLPYAESFEPYHSQRERRYPYYQIPVKNYTVFYVVIGNVMEVRRFLYSRSDWQGKI